MANEVVDESEVREEVAEEQHEDRVEAGNAWEGDGEAHREEHRHIRERLEGIETLCREISAKIPEPKVEPVATVTETVVEVSGQETPQNGGEDAREEKSRWKGSKNHLFF